MSTTFPVWSEDSSVGPPSRGLDIHVFLAQAQQAKVETAVHSLQDEWHGLEVGSSSAIENDCDLGSLCSRMDGVLSSPRERLLYESLQLEKLRTILRESSAAADAECLAWAHKVPLGQNGALAEQPIWEEGSANSLPRHDKDLKSWKVPRSAVHFIGRPSAHFTNTLADLVKHPSAPAPPVKDGQALVTISVYKCNIPRWSPLVLHSRHVFASTHTLQDLADILGRCCGDIPSEESLSCDIRFAGFRAVQSPLLPPKYQIQNDRVHVNTLSGPVTPLESAGKDGRFGSSVGEWGTSWPPCPSLETGLPIHEAAFNGLLLELNKPYLFIHQGSCQHPFTIDEIRLRQRHDPSASELPFTTFMSWMPGSKCKVCLRMPAAMSVIGDPHLGESQSLLCNRCWMMLHPSQPLSSDDIQVVSIDS